MTEADRESGGKGVPSRLARTGLVLGMVYAPQLAAFVLGPLAECRHCVVTFWKLFLVLPGLLPAVVLRNSLGYSETALAVIAGVWTAGVLVAALVLQSRGGRAGRIGLSLVAVLTAANAVAASFALRA